ncbi:MAG: hypothetical protein N3E50_04725 [Candidatus Goldbacteria bacterium]|nr:hypothetical protein [Candidatus Goldiibacteriota bacterium]
MQKKDVFFISSFALISFLIFLPQYISDKIIGWLDMIFYFVPFKEIIVENLRKGILPLWNPYIYCGQPLLANFQSAVFYPMNIFYYVFPIDIAFKINTFLIYFLMATFLYMLSKKMNFTEEAAFVTSFLFSFSSYMTIRASEWADLHTIAWMPASIYFLRMTFIDKRIINNFLTVITLTMSFLSGHPQVFSYVFLLFTAFYFYWFGLKNLIRYLLFILCLFLITAVQIIPTIEFATLSSRMSEYRVFLDAHKNIYMRFEHLLQIFFPFIKKFFSESSKFMNWMALIDIGLAGTLLAIFGIAKLSDIKLKDFLLILFTISFVFSFLNSIPNYSELYEKLFFLHYIRYPAKINVIFFFVMCFFAGVGFDLLFNKDNKNKIGFLYICLILNIIFIFVFILLNNYKIQILGFYIKNFSPGAEFEYILNNVYSYDMFLDDAAFFLILLFLFVVFLYFIIYKQITNYFIKIIFVLFIIYCVFAFNRSTYGSFVRYNDFNGETKISNFLIKHCSIKTKRILAPTLSNPKSNIMKKSKITVEEKYDFVRSTLQPNIPFFYKILNLDGFDSLIISSTYNFVVKINKFNNPWDNDFFPLTATKYIVSKIKLKGKKIKQIFFDELHNIFIFERENVPDIVYFVPFKYTIFTKNKEEEFNELYNTSYIYDKKIVIDTKYKDRFIKNLNDKKEKINIKISYERKNINTLIIDINNNIDGFVVISENFYPGWIATVNEIKQEIIKVNGFLKGVFIRPGKNFIKLEYRPKIIYYGYIISFLSLLFLAMSIFFRRKNERL